MRRRVLATAALTVLLTPACAHALLPTWERGVNIPAYWWSDLTGPRFETTLKRARDDERVRWVTFVVPWYQGDLHSTHLFTSPGSRTACRGQDGSDYTRCKTPSIAAIRSAVRRAKRLGLHVVLRPQVEVGRSPAQEQPRDLIDATDRGAWFASYTSLLLDSVMRVARDEGVEKLVIGAGLSAMTNDEADRAAWRALIARVRAVYRGRLSYAAQWDSIIEDALDTTTQPFFWDLLDEIGIDAYFPLVGSGAPGDPGLAQLRAGWTSDPTGIGASPVQLIRNLHGEYAKNVRFTALGYLARNGTAAFPEKGDAQLAADGGTLALTAQSRAIRAAFEVWAPISFDGWFRGISWWEWPASGRGGRGDGSFSLIGKPGAAEVCRGHAASRRARCPVRR